MNEREPIRLDAALRQARERIDAADAETLLIHALGRDRAWLFAHATDTMPPEALRRYESLLSRRAQGEPVAYLLGRRAFWTLQLETTPAVLIPRPETELLVEQAVARIDAGRAALVADLGTGSGAIALSIAVERPQARVVATDVSREALSVARSNADKHEIGNVEFRQGDWLSALAGESFDVIASNPPYIVAGDPHLQQGDLRFEPPGALASGSDGLDAIRIIVRDSPAHLLPGGWLLLEHGWEQGGKVRGLLQAAGFAEVATVRDLEDRDRVTSGRLAL